MNDPKLDELGQAVAGIISLIDEMGTQIAALLYLLRTHGVVSVADYEQAVAYIQGEKEAGKLEVLGKQQQERLRKLLERFEGKPQ